MPICPCNIFKTLSVLAKGTKAAMAKSSNNFPASFWRKQFMALGDYSTCF